MFPPLVQPNVHQSDYSIQGTSVEGNCTFPLFARSSIRIFDGMHQEAGVLRHGNLSFFSLRPSPNQPILVPAHASLSLIGLPISVG